MRRLRSRRAGAIARATVTSLLALVCACSTHRSDEKAEAVMPGKNTQAEYVSGIAAAYYCTCERWPRSWAELRGFDDYLHRRSEDEGEAPMKRYEWSTADASVSVHADGSLIIRQGAEKESKAGPDADVKLKERKLETIAVPTPNCSRFDSGRFAAGCQRAAALSR